MAGSADENSNSSSKSRFSGRANWRSGRGPEPKSEPQAEQRPGMEGLKEEINRARASRGGGNAHSGKSRPKCPSTIPEEPSEKEQENSSGARGPYPERPKSKPKSKPEPEQEPEPRPRPRPRPKPRKTRHERPSEERHEEWQHDMWEAVSSPMRWAIEFFGAIPGKILSFLWWFIRSQWIWIPALFLIALVQISGMAHQSLVRYTGFSAIGLGASCLPTGIFGLRSGLQSEDDRLRRKRILIFDPPQHGGALEHLSSQSYILRQAYSTILQLPTDVSADLDQTAVEIRLIQGNFTKMIQGYELCHCNWRNDDIQFIYQIFDHNETLTDYENRRDAGLAKAGSWFDFLPDMGTRPWRADEILDIASRLTEPISSHQQSLGGSISCFDSSWNDMKYISILLGDPEHDLNIFRKRAPKNIARRVSGIRSSLLMTMKIIAAAQEELQKEIRMLKQNITVLGMQRSSIIKNHAELQKVMKAGKPDESSRGELKNAMQRLCQHVLGRKEVD